MAWIGEGKTRMPYQKKCDVYMSQLERIKYAEEDHDQSNIVCEILKAKLKVTAYPVVV